MNPDRLKLETALDHSRAEAALNVMSPNLDRTAYIAILRSLFGFVKGWEVWAESISSKGLADEVASRRRSSLLAADLGFFSSSLPQSLYGGPGLPFDDSAQILGAMYVVEGSTLGGQYIARHVERLFSLVPGQGNLYFRGYGDRTGEMWRGVKTLLEQVPASEEGKVLRGAKRLFADFAEWNANATGPYRKEYNG
jgi:heme oxygenase